MATLLNKAALRVSLLLVLTLSCVKADYFFTDSVIQVKEFTDKIETMGAELHQKTGWNLYLLAVDDIGEQKLIDYQKEQAQYLKKPFIMLTLAIKQGKVIPGHMDDRHGKVGIFGSDNYRQQFDYQEVLNGTLYPILGSKVKGDPRQKYITALYNGYAEIADQVAQTYNVELKSSEGNANRIVINTLRFVFYLIILGAVGIFTYNKFFKRVQA